MKTLKRILQRIDEMHRATYLLIKWSLIASCICLIIAGVLYIAAYSGNINPLHVLHFYKEFAAMPQSIMLLASVGSVCMEDFATR